MWVANESCLSRGGPEWHFMGKYPRGVMGKLKPKRFQAVSAPLAFKLPEGLLREIS